jgi:hypothetical protein
MDEKLALVYRYFQLLESFSADPVEFASIFHPNIIQTEYPNQLSNDIKQRNFDIMLESMVTNEVTALQCVESSGNRQYPGGRSEMDRRNRGGCRTVPARTSDESIYLHNHRISRRENLSSTQLRLL